VSYLRTVSAAGIIKVSLVMSKVKVTPIKLQTIPRLELEAAKIGVKLADYVMSSLGKSIKLEAFYWSDSTITLGWIRGEPHRWKTFVAHRVQLIHLKSRTDSWRHVNGMENPADLCSRGCSSEDLIDANLWWNGSPWLSGPQSSFPGEQEAIIEPDDPDYWKESRAGQVLITLEKGPPPPTVIKLERFRKWSRAVRAMAYVRRAFHKNPDGKYRKDDLSFDELQVAKMDIIRQVQRESFPTEFLALQDGQRPLRSSQLTGLRPYFDQRDSPPAPHKPVNRRSSRRCGAPDKSSRHQTYRFGYTSSPSTCRNQSHAH